MADKDYSKLEERIAYEFSDHALRQRAFIHASADMGDSYERLEFLGDAVLELIVSEYVFESRPGLREGEMTKTRAALVNEGALAIVAKDLSLRDYVILGKGERNSGGEDKPSILADVIEALIGAVYVDGGYEAAKSLVHRLMGERIDDVLSGGGVRDHKTRLQEYYHKTGTSDIRYNVYKEEGPPHNKVFFVKLLVDGEEIAKGKGKSKKMAEQRAAKHAFLNMNGRKE